MRDRNEHIIQMYCIDNQVSSLQHSGACATAALYTLSLIAVVCGVVMTSSWGRGNIDNTNIKYFCKDWKIHPWPSPVPSFAAWLPPTQRLFDVVLNGCCCRVTRCRQGMGCVTIQQPPDNAGVAGLWMNK